MTVFGKISKVAQLFWPYIPSKLRKKIHLTVVKRLASNSAPSGNLPTHKTPRIIVGYLSSHYSFGKVARLFSELLEEQGAPVYGIDISEFFPDHQTGFPNFLSPPPNDVLNNPHHVIFVANGNLLQHIMLCIGGSTPNRHSFVSAYWAWEDMSLPESWLPSFNLVQEIVVASSFVESAIRGAQPDAAVLVAPHPVAISAPPQASFDSMKTDDLVVLHVSNLASDAERKNTLGAVKSYCAAFASDSNNTLRLHLNNRKAAPDVISHLEKIVEDRPDIVVSFGVKSDEDIEHWWRGGHIFLSLHRSEGFGLAIAEAMSSGYCAVATGWSGNMEFMNESNSVCVRYQLVPRSGGQARPEWAEPDIEHAAAALRKLSLDRDYLVALAKRGQSSVAEVTKKSRTIQALHLE